MSAVQQLGPPAAELPSVAAPLLPFLGLHPDLAPPSPQVQPQPSPQLPSESQPVRCIDAQTSLHQEAQLDADSAAALALPPVLMPRHRMYQLTEKGILDVTGVSLVGMLTQLNLHGSALKRIEVSTMTALRPSALPLLKVCQEKFLAIAVQLGGHSLSKVSRFVCFMIGVVSTVSQNFPSTFGS